VSDWLDDYMEGKTEAIPFTQHLMPDGRKQTIWWEGTPELRHLASVLLAYGCCFEIEMLSDYATISATVERDDDEGEVEVFAHKLCRNGPMVPLMIDSLIKAAYVYMEEKESSNDHTGRNAGGNR